MIWLIAILLMAIFAGIGFLKGAIQTGISVVGLFVALLLAMPLAPLMESACVASGVTNLILLAVLPPIIAFLVVGLVFMIVGIVVHFKVKNYFSFKTDQATQTMWKRLNQRVGAAFGILIGAFYTVALGVGVYSAGYLTHQVATDSDPGWLKFITDTRVAMDGNGLGKMAASLDPMPEKYYEVSDLIGLSHRNPLLENRYRNYPPFLSLAEREDVQEIAADTEFHGMLVQQASLADIMNHPLGQKIMTNADLFDALVNQTDLKDLKQFLEKGESPIYDEEEILGRWELNGNALINYVKRNTAGIKSKELRELKELVGTYLDGASLIVYTDNRIKIDAPEPPEPEEPEQPAQGGFGGGGRFGGAGNTGGMSPEEMQRYGLNPGGLAAQSRARAAQQQAARPAQPEKPRISIGGGGSWERTAPGRYAVQLDGKPKVLAKFDKHRLIIKVPGTDLLFSRVY